MTSRNGLPLLAVTVLLLTAAVMGNDMMRRDLGIGWRVVCPARGTEIEVVVRWACDLPGKAFSWFTGPGRV